MTSAIEAFRGYDAMFGPFTITAGRLIRGVEMAMRDIARETGAVVEIDSAGGWLQVQYSVTFWGSVAAIERVESLVKALGAGPNE